MAGVGPFFFPAKKRPAPSNIRQIEYIRFVVRLGNSGRYYSLNGRLGGKFSADLRQHPNVKSHLSDALIRAILALFIFSYILFSGCASRVRLSGEEDQVVRVRFVFEGAYDSVCLSGDFNGWSIRAHCLERKGDTWHIELYIPAGRHRYAFYVDGSRWVPDPKALMQEDDGFGTKNSVLIVDSW